MNQFINSQTNELQALKQIVEKQSQEINHLKDLLNQVLAATDKSWKVIGTLGEFDTLINNYPLTTYEWAIGYNTQPLPVIVQNWNRGIRIFSKYPYSHGDNASSLHQGRAIFTRDTDDTESKGCFYHRYVDSNMNYCGVNCGQNGNSNSQPVYARKL